MGQLPSARHQQDNCNAQPPHRQVHVPVSYFRSRLYTAPYSSNPLLAAASPILSLLDRLGLSVTLPPIDQLRDDFKYELQAYHSRTQGKGQDNANHAIAYYLLATTIDELIARNYYRIHQQPVSFQAFSPVGRDEEPPGNQFFRVVEKIRQKPSQYLDIIEIAYFCLMAGFEGKYHNKVDGRQQIENLCEMLYQLVHQHRGHQKSPTKKPHQTNDKQTIKSQPFPIAVGISVVILATIIYFCHSLLDHKVETLALNSAVQTQWMAHHAT